jgi:hypothetical protein
VALVEAAQNILGPVLTAIGTFVVATGGLTAIAYGLFRLLGEKWLNAKFEERLAAYKHAQQRELEHLRFQINALLDRTTKLHQREFDVLPQAWSLFNDAYSTISGIMGFKSFPDVSRMTDAQVDEMLSKGTMPDWQKSELKAASNRTEYYRNYLSWMDIVEAHKVYGEWQKYFLKNGIFMTEPIKKKFSELDSILRGALVEQRMRHEEKDMIKISEMNDYRRLVSEGTQLRNELEGEVQSRLWSSANASSDTTQ